jgi:hydrogenase expression/formation protein HypC
MCLGVPMRLVAIDGIAGQTEAGELVDLSLLPDSRPGDWVLTFLGAGREVLTPDQAEKIIAALDGLAALMAGGSLGDAFADLDTRTPNLPSHLQAALDAGRSLG